MQCSNPPCPSLIVAEREKQCRSTPATVRRTHDLGSVAQSSATQSRSVLTPDGVVRRIEAGMLHDSVSLKPRLVTKKAKLVERDRSGLTPYNCSHAWQQAAVDHFNAPWVASVSRSRSGRGAGVVFERSLRKEKLPGFECGVARGCQEERMEGPRWSRLRSWC
jgi:hypothetical protein